MHLISVAEIYCGANEKYIPQFDKIIKNYDLEIALKEAENLVDAFLNKE